MVKLSSVGTPSKTCPTQTRSPQANNTANLLKLALKYRYLCIFPTPQLPAFQPTRCFYSFAHKYLLLYLSSTTAHQPHL